MNITRIIAIAITVGLSLFEAPSSNAQTFDAVQENPFGLTDIGSYSTPSFADLDDDGDLDLMVGAYNGEFYYFENLSETGTLIFETVETNPFSLTDIGSNSTPVLVDLDGDGDLDLMAGGYFGRFYYFENIGTASSPSLGTVQTNPFGLTDIGFESAPSFADLDGDGDLDLLSGESGGNFKYFENTGTTTAPNFGVVEETPFGLTDIGHSSRVSFGDIDNDGDLDLISGDSRGNFYFFKNVGTANEPCFLPVQTNPFALIDISSNSTPSFTDLDGDGDLDLMTGESGGNFGYFENITIASTASAYTVVISDDYILDGETATVTITFSEAVTGFTNDDLIVTSGTLSAVSSSDGNITFTATFTPDANTEVACDAITLDNTGVTDGTGNPGVGTTDSNIFAVDTKGPSATLTIDDTRIGIGDDGILTITFSETAYGFDNSDLTVPNGTLSAVTSTDGNVTFTATFTPTSTAIEDDTNVITLDNTGVADEYGNVSIGTTDSNNFTVDTQRPTATVTIGDTVITDGEIPTVTFTLSERASLDHYYLTYPNGAISNFISTDGSITFTTSFTPTPGITDATNVISLDLTLVMDRAGNVGVGTVYSDNFTIEVGFPDIIFDVVKSNPFGLTDNARSKPFLADLDGDGDLDLMSGEYYGNFYYSENTGTTITPSFAAVQSNPFGLTDIGFLSTLSLGDLDNDGDLDLMAGEEFGNLKYFENTGSDSIPSFATVQTNPFSLTDIGTNSAPSFGDLDGDGDLDLMSGEDYGNFYYFENTGSVSSPSFETAQTNPFGLTRVGFYSAPSFVDLDDDGDLDLMSGESGGKFYYFENIGTDKAPSFGPIQTIPFYLTDIGHYSSPSFADLDGDGDIDLMAGEAYGNFKYFENISETLIVWDGETSTDWATATNWDGDVAPDSTSTVTIPNVTNDPVITSDVEVKTIDIETDATVTITTNSLKVQGTTTLDGSLTIASGASYIPIGSISGSGSANIKRNTSFGTEDGKYSVIGSPITSGSTSSLGGIVYSYDETIAYDAGGTDGSARFVAVNTPETMSIADAYFSANTGDITFTGMPNSEDIDVSLIYDETNDGATNAGFNLVSNPYTAAISYADFVSDNTDIDGTIYLWDDGGSNTAARTNADYITINSVGASGGSEANGGSGRSTDWDGYIRSAQGFFVKANTGGTLSFTPSMMDVGNNSDDGYFRQAQPTVLRFSVSSSKSYNDILIAFSEKATEGLDRSMDAHKIRSNSALALYSKSNESNLAIQALPIAKEQVTVDLGLDAAEAGTYTLTLEDAASYEFEVYLKDNKLDKTINLSETKTYTFETGAIYGSDRFSLVFAPNQILSLDEEITKNELVVFSNENGLNVKVEAQISNATVRIYDLSGALIKQAEHVDFTQSNWTTGFNESGLFILTVQSKNEFLTKKFIKL